MSIIPRDCQRLEDFHIVFLFKSLGLEIVSPRFVQDLEAIVKRSNESWKYRAYCIELLGLQCIQEDPANCPHKEFVEDPSQMSAWVKKKCLNYSQTVTIVRGFYS